MQQASSHIVGYRKLLLHLSLLSSLFLFPFSLLSFIALLLPSLHIFVPSLHIFVPASLAGYIILTLPPLSLQQRLPIEGNQQSCGARLDVAGRLREVDLAGLVAGRPVLRILPKRSLLWGLEV